LDKKYSRCVEHRDGQWHFVGLQENKSLKERSRVGLAGYQKWWKERVATCTQDLAAGMEELKRAAWSTWRGCDDGSRPFHWRCPEEYQVRIRDSMKVHHQHNPPCYCVPQRDTKDPDTKAKVIGMLTKVRLRRYIGPGFVVSLTAFFHVPKGEDDLCLVYNGSVSGLNDAVWMPRFILPMLNTHLRSVEAGTFLGDIDVGERFLSFILYLSVRVYAGVDLTSHFPLAGGGTLWETWHWAAVGLKSSPYQACQAMGFAEEVIWGNRRDSEICFIWTGCK
jgi:hypothetical protein